MSVYDWWWCWGGVHITNSQSWSIFCESATFVAAMMYGFSSNKDYTTPQFFTVPRPDLSFVRMPGDFLYSVSFSLKHFLNTIYMYTYIYIWSIVTGHHGNLILILSLLAIIFCYMLGPWLLYEKVCFTTPRAHSVVRKTRYGSEPLLILFPLTVYFALLPSGFNCHRELLPG